MKSIRRIGRALLRIFRRPLPTNNNPLVCCGDLPRPIRRKLAIRDIAESRTRYHRKAKGLGVA
jgi:hypothetical protein